MLNVQDTSSAPATSSYHVSNDDLKPNVNFLASDISNGIARWTGDSSNDDSKSIDNILATDTSNGIASWERDSSKDDLKSIDNILATDTSNGIARWTGDSSNDDSKSIDNILATDTSNGIASWERDSSKDDLKSIDNILATDTSNGIARWTGDSSNDDSKSIDNILATDTSTGIASWARDSSNSDAKSAATQTKSQASLTQNSIIHEQDHEHQNQITNTERFSSLGMYHGFDDFRPTNTILLGGYWSNVNMTGSLHCFLGNVSMCQVKTAINEHRQCFQYHDQNEILKYGSQLLNTSNVKLVKPDTKMYGLPFPTPFNVTVVRTIPLAGCQKNPITCHPMNSDGCLIYVCHVLHNTKAFQVTVKNNKVNGYVNMIGICHYETKQFMPSHLAFRLLHKQPGDVVCHFVGVANYLMCINDKE